MDAVREKKTEDGEGWRGWFNVTPEEKSWRIKKNTHLAPKNALKSYHHHIPSLIILWVTVVKVVIMEGIWNKKLLKISSYCFTATFIYANIVAQDLLRSSTVTPRLICCHPICMCSTATAAAAAAAAILLRMQCGSYPLKQGPQL